MITPLFQSQAGQDRFVHAILVEKMGFTHGTFLDIGANHPINYSNTYALEELGWTGVLMDNDTHVMEICGEIRPHTPFIRADATEFDFKRMLPAFFAGQVVIDYLSLDVDQATGDTLEKLLQAPFRYRIATIEHDAYRFGPEPRKRIRSLMEGQGYQLICGNVKSQDMEFEDWWVDPSQVDLAAARFFECEGIDGMVITAP